MMASTEFTIRKRLFLVLENCSKETLEKYEIREKKESPTVVIAIDSNITKWCLCINPNGDREEDRSNIGCYLTYIGSDSTKFTSCFTFGILGKTEKENFKELELQRTGEEWAAGGIDVGYGKTQFISHDKLFDEYQGLIINDKLTFFCDLIVTTLSLQNIRMNQTLAYDYEAIFEEELFTDFKMIMNDDKTLKAHKAVLAARSPVFFAMLQQDMKEANENVVEIPDFDSIVMKEFLRFLYCNEIKDLPSVANELIYIADKYLDNGLKEICTDAIISSLSTGNVVKSLIIADRMPETKNLFNECLKLIISNPEIVGITGDWKDLPNDIALKTIRALSTAVNQRESILAPVEDPPHRDVNKVELNKALADHYKKLFDDELFTDFQFKAKDGKVLKAHKAILATRSQTAYKELKKFSTGANEDGPNYPGFDSIVLKETLRFFYCNKVQDLPSVARKVVYATEEFKLKGLKQLCIDEISSSLNIENALESLIISERITETKDLFTKCLKFLTKNIEIIKATDAWKDLPQDIALKMVCEMSPTFV